MSYRFVVSEDLYIEIIDSDGAVLERTGPWVDNERAEMWASAYCSELNSGTRPDPRLPVVEPTE